jgi:hypothetical protein
MEWISAARRGPCCAAIAIAIAALAWAAPAHASPWCGSPASVDRSPNVVAGRAVRVVYMIPADGQDRLDRLAPAIESDTERIAAWWQAQDPTRAIRFDLAPFSCGPQLDIDLVRMAQSGSVVATHVVWITRALSAPFDQARYAKYLVYYDGPVADPDTCGAGEGYPDIGPGYAIVFLRACVPLVPSATVAAHELLHALGAVPLDAPHSCPFPKDGHTCDSRQDVMYPYADGSTLDTLLLDPGRDDYYGHSGSWFDVQDSPWLVRLDRQVTLAVSVAGAGSVASDVPGLTCAAACTTSWNAGVRLVLTPRAAAGMRFVRWTGACSGRTKCALTLRHAADTVAVFAPVGRRSQKSVRRALRTLGS